MKKIFIGLALLFIITCAYADNLGQIRDTIRYKLNDSATSTNNPTWTDTELNKRINAVAMDVARITRCLYTNQITTTTTDVREYLKPTRCIAIDRVSYINVSSITASNQYKKLTFVTMGGLDRDMPSWEYNTSGMPTKYYERGDYIGFERPVSAVYASTGALKVDYYKYPETMTLDADLPFDSATYLQPYCDTIVLGVVYKCKQDEMKWSEATAIQTEYVSLVNLMIDNLNARSDSAVQKIKIGE